MNKKYQAALDQYYARLPKYHYGIRLRAKIVNLFAGNITDKKILDVGCGNGSISIPLFAKKNDLTLIDISEDMLALAKKNFSTDETKKIHLIQDNFEEYQFGTTFDIILCLGFLAYVYSMDQTIKKISNLLNPNGLCVLQFNNYSNPLTQMQFLTGSVRAKLSGKQNYNLNKIRWTDLQLLLNKYGLTVAKERGYSFLLPGMGILPDNLLFHYQEFSFENRFFSKLGAEKMLLLRKSG